jgi:sn-glycerol 3-phosphate transport system permease protein
MPAEAGVATRPADEVLGVPEHELRAATIGQSSSRHTLGLVGQYGLLVVLAAIVLGPIAFALLQALSPPFDYINAGKPLHPVHVDWKDRTWLSGGAFSVVARTAVVALALAWVQLRAAGSTLRHPAPLAAPRRIAAVVVSVVVLAVLVSGIWRSAFERSGATAWWWIAAFVGVAAAQLIGFGDLRPAWKALLLAALTSVGVVTFAQVVTSILAAYAFAFLRFPGKNLIFALFMGTLLLPLEVTLLANVQTIRELGWINSNAGLVAPFAATAFGTFLIRQGFRGVPPEIQDATRLDGYGHMAFLWRFAVPLTRPVIASFTVISALGAWNQYLWPQAVIDDSRYQTAQIRLKTIVGTEVANANVGVAAALLVAVPVVILLIAFQRQIIRGLTAGAVKG